MFYCCEEHVLTLREEQMLLVLRRMYGPWREEVKRGLHNEELHYAVYSAPKLIQAIK
jgi:hypothetical protein